MAPVKKPKHNLQRTFLKEWRESRDNMSQEEAAEKLNISRSLLSKIENAKSPYTQQLMEKAAALYGCDVADLISRNPLDGNDVWTLQKQIDKAPDLRELIIGVVDQVLKTAKREQPQSSAELLHASDHM